jgi:hypothetical protein
VLILAASWTPDDLGRAYDLGANACHAKLRQPAELLQTMRAMMSFWFDVATLPIKRGELTPCYTS